MKSEDVLRALMRRYKSPEWVAIPELARTTGGGTRRIDLFALNTYQSKGFVSHAIEIKVSRADFLRELARPEKRRVWRGVASQLWFAMPAGCAKLDEIPEGWGYLQLGRTGKLRRVKAAHQVQVDSLPADLVATIARRAVEPVNPALWEINGRKVTGAELWRLAQRYASFGASNRLRALRYQLEEFEKQRRPGLVAERRQAHSLFHALRRAGAPIDGGTEAVQEWLTSLGSGDGTLAGLRRLRRQLEFATELVDRMLPGGAS